MLRLRALALAVGVCCLDVLCFAGPVALPAVFCVVVYQPAVPTATLWHALVTKHCACLLLGTAQECGW
jgi:hypothetical protein